jgi:hypothetical protein
VKGARNIGIVIVVAVGLLGSAVGADAATSAAGHMRYAIDNNPSFPNLSQTAQRNEYVILKPSETNRLQQIKAANPNVKVLMYKNLSASIDYPSDVYLTAGVSHDEADSQHPEWFLLNTSGQRFTHKDYGNLWAMDVGSASYQQRWADNVLRSLKTLGFDGVFIDDTNPTMKGHYDPTKVAKYPTDEAYQQATESALAKISPQLRSAGYSVVANIGHFGEFPDVGQRWLQYVDGAMDENFGKWGNTAGSGYAWEGYWKNELRSLKFAQQHGKDFLAVTHSADGDAAAARYGWGTMLLGANGHAQFALHSNYTSENWFAEYDYEIGEPVGQESLLSSGAHRRQFSNGMVVVNPTSNQVSVDLCGGTYSGSGRSHVTSVQLGANAAAILTLDTGSSAGSCGTDSGSGSTGSGSTGGDASGGGTGGDASGGSTGGDASGGGTTVQPGKGKVKKGKIVATGTISTSADQTALASATDGDGSFKGTEVELEVERHRGGGKSTDVGVGPDGSFVAKVKVCEPGRYEVHALDPVTGERLTWPETLRVGRRQLRC